MLLQFINNLLFDFMCSCSRPGASEIGVLNLVCYEQVFCSICHECHLNHKVVVWLPKASLSVD